VYYRIVARHKFRGNSTMNMFASARKYIREEDPQADIVALGHNHVAGMCLEPIHGRQRCLVRVGTYKVMDRYTDHAGFVDSHCITPVVLLNTRRKEMMAANSIQQASEMLTALNK
jgi:hypothetical protein